MCQQVLWLSLRWLIPPSVIAFSSRCYSLAQPNQLLVQALTYQCSILAHSQPQPSCNAVGVVVQPSLPEYLPFRALSCASACYE